MINCANIKLEENVSLKEYNTYKIEAKCKYLATVLNKDGLKEIIEYANKLKLPYFLIGCGSNIVLDEYFNGIVIKLAGLNKIEITDNLVVVEAGAKMGLLANKTVDNS